MKWGERPMAFVILHPQHVARWSGRHHEFAEELKEHAKSRLPGFACPEWVEVVPELPVSYSLVVVEESNGCDMFRKLRRARYSRQNYGRSLQNFELVFSIGCVMALKI